MKKGLRNIFIFIVLALVMFSMCFQNVLRVHAEEVEVEPQEQEVVETNESEKSEIATWFDERVVPHLFTFVSSLGGTGAIISILIWIVKKALKEAKEKLEQQTRATAKSEEEYQEKVKQLEEYEKALEVTLTELITKYMTDYEGKLDEAIAKLDLQAEEYQKTKEKGEALGNKLLEVFKDDVK